MNTEEFGNIEDLPWEERCYYELAGVLADYDHDGTFDDVCVKTLERVQGILWKKSQTQEH